MSTPAVIAITAGQVDGRQGALTDRSVGRRTGFTVAGPLQISPGFLACHRRRSSHTSAFVGRPETGGSRTVLGVEQLDIVGVPAGGGSSWGGLPRADHRGRVPGRRPATWTWCPLDAAAAERMTWPSPLRFGASRDCWKAVPGAYVGPGQRRPLVSGIGTTLIDLLGPEAVRIHPAVSSVALARARMGWAERHGTGGPLRRTDLDLVRRHLGPAAVIVLSPAPRPRRRWPGCWPTPVRAERADRAR